MCEESRLFKMRGWSYRLNDRDRTACVERGRIGRGKRFRLPEYVDADGVRYTLTSVGFCAFNFPKTLQHLVIPDSYNYVDEDTFRFLRNLRTVHIGRNVQWINSWHFSACPKLNHIGISPNNPYLKIVNNLILSKDGKRVLRTVTDAWHYTVPEGVEEIADIVFWCNEKLESVSFPTTLRRIGQCQFQACRNLRKMVFPEGVVRIGCQCFFDCRNLEHVEFPSTLEELGDEPFYNCPKLKTVVNGIQRY